MATSDDEAAYRAVITFCVELVMTPVETHRHLKSVERHANVSRALVYKWYGRFSKGWSENPDSSKRGGPKNYEDSIVLKFPSVININVGGRIFATRLSTLTKYPDSMLAVMFSGRHRVDQDLDKNYFIDRDGTYFIHILNFLRDEEDLPPISCAESVLKEAMYYGITSLINILKASPVLFAEYVVRDNIRNKLLNYQDVKLKLIYLAREQASKDGAIVSVVKLITTKNQPIPRDLQFSKQVYKQYFRKFKLYESFEQCYGKHYVNLTTEDVVGHPDDVMDLVAACLHHDLIQEGYRGTHRSEGIHAELNKIKTVTWCDEEFHVCTSCHIFNFDWLDSRGD